MKPVLKLMGAWMFASTLATSTQAASPGWPAYRGPKHDGVSSEKLPRSTWAASGPKQLWKTPTPAGFSSVTVADGKACTLVARDVDGARREVLVGLDATTGKELWAVNLSPSKYDGGGDSGTADNKGGDGPRSTPTIANGRVYALDGKLVLFCVEASTGKEIWKKDLVAEHAARNITWQNAASPLLDGGLLFVAGGGEGQALLGIDAKSGKTVWKGENDRMTHATPVAATILGQHQVLFFTQSGLAAVEPKTGKVLWRQSFPYKTSTAASPIVDGNLVYCSAGYGVGAGVYRITKDGGAFKSTEVWRAENKLQNHWSTPVLHKGHLYGLFGFKEYGACPLKCVELATGKEKWSQTGFGPGNVTLVDGHLLVLGDAGQLVLVEAVESGYKEKARTDVLDGKCWSTPSYTGGRVYARSTKEAVCVDLAAAP